MKKQDLETPALLMDLDALESNLTVMADAFRHQPAKARPHFKNHSILALAARQIEAGAIGITVARVRHAEALVSCGIRSILIANEIVDESSIRRLLDLSQKAEIIVAVDSPTVIALMGRLANDAGHTLDVVVDLDVGLGRCGVPVTEALPLARLARDSGLRVRGLMGYEGHLQKLPNTEETKRLRDDVARALTECRQLLEKHGFPVDIVSMGGTATYKAYTEFPSITEIQVGSYLLTDTWSQPFAPDFRLGLTVLSRIISKRDGEQLVLDAGMKAISSERGLPSIKDRQALEVTALHAEHAIVKIQPGAMPAKIGDRLELWAAYSDATVHLHRQMYGVRGDTVKEVFQIEY